MARIRVEESIKARATEALATTEIPGSDAVRVLPTHVIADQQLPFDLKEPNAETQAAMKESRALMATRRARFTTADALIDNLEKNSRK